MGLLPFTQVQRSIRAGGTLCQTRAGHVYGSTSRVQADLSPGPSGVTIAARPAASFQGPAVNAPAANSIDTTPAAPRCPVDERYRERLAAASQEIAQLAARDRSWNVVRIVVTLALFPAGLLVWQDLLPVWALGLHAVVAVAIALRHERILEQLQVARALETIHRRQLTNRHQSRSRPTVMSRKQSNLVE